MRKYVILVKNDDEVGFVPVGTAVASSRDGALRAHFAGTTVDCIAAAVPERNWKPEPVRHEVQTHLKIG